MIESVPFVRTHRQLVRLIFATIGLIIFLLLAFGVLNHASYITTIDKSFQLLIQHRSAFNDWLFMNITRAGNPKFAMLLTLLACFILLYERLYKEMAFLFVNGFVLTATFAFVVKGFVHRARPSLQLIQETGYSFPSGHALVAMLLYGSLIVICKANLKNKLIRRLTYFILLFFIIMIPISRVYINVHYPTDVIAGLSIGYTLLFISRSIFIRWNPAIIQKIQKVIHYENTNK